MKVKISTVIKKILLAAVIIMLVKLLFRSGFLGLRDCLVWLIEN